jgi:integrase
VKIVLKPRSLAALLKDRPQGRIIVRDQSPQSPAGFVLRLSETSASYYVVARKRWHLVGNTDVLSLDEARRVARVLLGRIAEGRDPSDERRAERERRKTETATRREQRRSSSGPTLAGLIARSLESKEGRLSQRTLREWTRTLVRDISSSTIGQTQASEVKRDDLAAWLRNLAERGGPHQSDRVLNLARAAFKWALDEEAAGHGFGLLRDPTRGLRPQVSRNALIRTRSLIAEAPSERTAFEEMAQFWKLTDRLGLVDRVFARVILLCATRHDETKRARWSELDLDGVPSENTPPTWRIPAARRKGGEHRRARAMVIPLSSLAVAELRALREARPADAVVFAGLRANVGERIRKATIPDIKVHDLRRSCASAVQRLGASESEVKLVLGHVLATGATASYAHSAPLALHASLLQRFADAITRHVGSGDGRVIPAAARFGA